MSVVGSIVALVKADASGFKKGLDSAAARSQQFASQVTGAFGGIGGKLAAAAGGLSVVAGIGKAISLASEAEDAHIAMKVLLKDTEAAKKLIGEIRQFANTTPLEFPELQQAGKMLLAFGTAPAKVIDELKVLGNIAAAVGVSVTELADVYGRNRAQGRLFARDINEFTARGIPVIKALAKQFGVAESAIKDMVEDGKIQFTDLQQALQDMATGEGQFAGGLEERGKTLSGRFSTLKDTIRDVARVAGESIVQGFNLKGGVEQAIQFTESLRSSLPSVEQIAAAVQQVGAFFQPVLGFVESIWRQSIQVTGSIAGWIAQTATYIANLGFVQSAVSLIGDAFREIGQFSADIGQQVAVAWVGAIDVIGESVKLIGTAWDVVAGKVYEKVAGLAGVLAKIGESAAWLDPSGGVGGFGDTMRGVSQTAAMMSKVAAADQRGAFMRMMDQAGKVGEAFRRAVDEVPSRQRLADERAAGGVASASEIADQITNAASEATAAAAAGLNIVDSTSPAGLTKATKTEGNSLLEAGSQAAYKAMDALRNAMGDKQLAEAQKQTQVQREIAANTKAAPKLTVATI